MSNHLKFYHKIVELEIEEGYWVDALRTKAEQQAQGKPGKMQEIYIELRIRQIEERDHLDVERNQKKDQQQ